EKAEVETLLRDVNKEFPNDDNVKKLFEQYKGFFKETFLLEETKGQEASGKTKPAAVKAKDSAEMPKPVKNVKELAEKRKEPAKKAHEAPQNELAEKPKEPAGDDYQVVHAATIMKAEDHEEFEVETFTQWIEGNIDWVGEGYVKPVKTVNTPYMCRRIDVTARCKRIEFVLGNSLFAMEGDKYETVFKSLGGYRELSSKSFYNEIKDQFKYEPSSMSLSDFELVFFPIYASDHFYVVVFNIKKPKTMVILDNSYSGYGYASKYKETYDPLKKLFSRYKIATKIMLHQFNAVSDKMFDFAFTFETKYTEQARVSMIVDAIKNRNNHDPPKQVKETESANVVVGVNGVVEQVKEKWRRKK
nr:ulp1 protease family, C-terminal catalytic domain-containing protein [Tanacetum cinerariifolium]